jgi:ABC-2 type transport system ATP-binding protein
MIEARELTRRYGSLLAVDRVSFEVRPGEIVGLLGPNGAGKTTILRILTGYHFPHEGEARISGFDVVAEPIEAKRRIGYLPENAPAYGDLSVREYLGFICGARAIAGAAARTATERVVALCALESVWHRPIGQLSKGFRQRVGLAQALIHDPQVVVLDEPTSGLDPNQIREVRRIVAELGTDRAVLFSTHILREAEAVCRRVLILDAGRIIAGGTPAEIARGLRSRALVTVSLVGTPPEAALAALARIGETVVERTEEGSSVLRIALHDGRGAEDLFDWAVETGVRLTSVVPESDSLEEIFARLTTGGDA